MTVPQINPNEVASGNLGMLIALTAVRDRIGNAKLALFLDFVPERGKKLMDRFRSFQETAGDVSFIHFVERTLTTDRVAFFYPKGCMLSSMMRGLLVPAIQRVLRGKHMSDDDLVNIHFGVGESYEAVRSVACKGCDRDKCAHWINPNLFSSHK